MLRITSHPHPPQYRFIITQCSWWKLSSFSFLQILSRKPRIGLCVREEKEYIRENTPSSLQCPHWVSTCFLPSGLTFYMNIPLHTWKLVQMQTYNNPFPEPKEVLLPPSCNWVSWDGVWNYIKAGKLKPFWCLLQRHVHQLAWSPLAGWPAQAINSPCSSNPGHSGSSRITTSGVWLERLLPLLPSCDSKTLGTLWL